MNPANQVELSDSDSEDIFFGPITKREIMSKLKHYNLCNDELLEPLQKFQDNDVLDDNLIQFYYEDAFPEGSNETDNWKSRRSELSVTSSNLTTAEISGVRNTDSFSACSRLSQDSLDVSNRISLTESELLKKYDGPNELQVELSDSDSEDIFFGPITKREIMSKLKHYNLCNDELLEPLQKFQDNDVLDDNLIQFYYEDAFPEGSNETDNWKSRRSELSVTSSNLTTAEISGVRNTDSFSACSRLSQDSLDVSNRISLTESELLKKYDGPNELQVELSDSDSEDIFFGPITKREIMSKLKHYNLCNDELLEPLQKFQDNDVLDDNLIQFYYEDAFPEGSNETDNWKSRRSELSVTSSNLTTAEISGVRNTDSFSACSRLSQDSLDVSNRISLTESELLKKYDGPNELQVELSDSDSEDIFFGPITKREIMSKLKHYNLCNDELLEPLQKFQDNDVLDDNLIQFYYEDAFPEGSNETDNWKSRRSELSVTSSNLTTAEISGVRNTDSFSACSRLSQDSLDVSNRISLTESELLKKYDGPNELQVELSDSDSEDIFFGPITKREIMSKLKHYNLCNDELLEPLQKFQDNDVLDDNLIQFYYEDAFPEGSNETDNWKSRRSELSVTSSNLTTAEISGVRNTDSFSACSRLSQDSLDVSNRISLTESELLKKYDGPNELPESHQNSTLSDSVFENNEPFEALNSVPQNSLNVDRLSINESINDKEEVSFTSVSDNESYLDLSSHQNILKGSSIDDRKFMSIPLYETISLNSTLELPKSISINSSPQKSEPLKLKSKRWRY